MQLQRIRHMQERSLHVPNALECSCMCRMRWSCMAMRALFGGVRPGRRLPPAIDFATFLKNGVLDRPPLVTAHRGAPRSALPCEVTVQTALRASALSLHAHIYDVKTQTRLDAPAERLTDEPWSWRVVARCRWR
eukprot:2867172-Prymnesium_polylepis.4